MLAQLPQLSALMLSTCNVEALALHAVPSLTSLTVKLCYKLKALGPCGVLRNLTFLSICKSLCSVPLTFLTACAALQTLHLTNIGQATDLAPVGRRPDLPGPDPLLLQAGLAFDIADQP